MKFKKLLLLLLFPFIAEFFVACCHCADPVYSHYTNKTLTLSNIDNSGEAVVITDKDSVIKTAYGIRVNIAVEKTASLSLPHSIFTQSANAYDCRCEMPLQIEPRDSIIQIQVITQNDFDAQHLSGSDVSEYFLEYKDHIFRKLSLFETKASAVLYDADNLNVSFDLLLMQAPSMNVSHAFKVRISLSDNRIFEQEITIKLY